LGGARIEHPGAASSEAMARERYVEARTGAVLGHADMEPEGELPILCDMEPEGYFKNLNLERSSCGRVSATFDITDGFNDSSARNMRQLPGDIGSLMRDRRYALGDNQEALHQEANALRFALGGTCIEQPGTASSERMVQSFRDTMATELSSPLATERSFQPEPEPDQSPVSSIRSAALSPNQIQNLSIDSIPSLFLSTPTRPLSLENPPARGRQMRPQRHPFSPDADLPSDSDVPEVPELGSTHSSMYS